MDDLDEALQKLHSGQKLSPMEWELALTSAFDWVEQPHRAPITDAMAEPSVVANVMHVLSANAASAKLPHIAFAWKVEARIREQLARNFSDHRQNVRVWFKSLPLKCQSMMLADLEEENDFAKLVEAARLGKLK
jgi:hypothetical protein